MAGGSLLTLLDDIAALLDDVALMTKKAASKTAGVLGDDLALNAQQVSGVVANRELPVVWAVAKGSSVNKLILVPAALVISVYASWLVKPLLMIGGLYLCYEGVEKLAHKIFHKEEKKTVAEAKAGLAEAATSVDVDEKAKIKGAVRTDFVLSAEIIAITLSVVENEPLATQAITLSAIALFMTVGVYGLVAGIVKLDDLGLYLSQRASAATQAAGRGILWAAPFLMKTLSVLGTAAMFLVGGEILTHGIHSVHHWIEHTSEAAGSVGKAVLPPVLNALFGVAAGIVALIVMMGVNKLRGKPAR